MWKRRDRERDGDRHGMGATRRPRPSAGWRSQRGAAIVEAAIVMPFVLTLTLGIIEFGFVWKDTLAISSAVRSAARIASADGKNAAADYDALQQIKAGLSGFTINKVIIFKANSSGTVPSTCTSITVNATSTPQGVAGVCSVYGPDDLNLTSASFACASSTSSPDWNWCPNTTVTATNGPRIDSRAGNSGAGPDYVGVYVQVNHTYVTKIIGDSKNLSDTTILRIEPTT